MKKLLVACLILALGALPVPAFTQKAEDAPEVEPKFIWGVIIVKYVAGQALSMFSQWMVAQMNQKYGTNISSASYSATAMDLARLAIARYQQTSDTTGGALIERNPTLVPVALKNPAQVALANPTTPLTVSDGSENYQGVHIAIVGATRDGTLTELRPVNAGFRTGERFKLRAVSTFGGLLVIENINPRGERKQIYPPTSGAVVVLQPGADTLLPLGKDELFEFARYTGEEQLVISLRDPRAVGAAVSRQKVYRKDEEYGSHFVQETSKGTYPAISESIRLRHDN